MLGGARGHWPQGGQRRREKLFTPSLEVQREMRRYQEPPPAPSPALGSPRCQAQTAVAEHTGLKLHQQHIPLPATLSLSLCLEQDQLSREGEDREKDWRGTASLLRVLGTEPVPPHRSKPLGDDVLGRELCPASKGRQAKASREEPAPACPGTGHKGNPSRPRAHKCHHHVGKQERPREGEQPFQSLSHIRCWKGGR